MSRCIVELFNYIRIFDQIFIVRLINFEKTVETRCKIQPPAEVLFSRTNARCKIQPPAGENSVSRAPTICSAPKRRFSAPVGDAVREEVGASVFGNNGLRTQEGELGVLSSLSVAN
jgi:hypothetical protein